MHYQQTNNIDRNGSNLVLFVGHKNNSWLTDVMTALKIIQRLVRMSPLVCEAPMVVSLSSKVASDVSNPFSASSLHFPHFYNEYALYALSERQETPKTKGSSTAANSPLLNIRVSFPLTNISSRSKPYPSPWAAKEKLHPYRSVGNKGSHQGMSDLSFSSLQWLVWNPTVFSHRESRCCVVQD